MPLLRLRSDEQLVALFRDGHDEAFRVIHDRYRQRLFAYTRQMLHGSRQDAEDALQDVFVRAYAGLRANDRRLALRAWLYRVAHNRCIDELRRPAPPAPELFEFVRAPAHDPIVEAEQRESLRRLIEDVRRLPEQQRSALLMRELSGMSYSELADALVVSVPAVKSLLVRARIGLAQSMQARDTACSEIRNELSLAHDRGVRPNGLARRHLRDCACCREFRGQVRGVSRQFAALVPALGPAGLLANLLGAGGGTGGGAAASGGAAVTGAAGGGSLFAAGGLTAGGAGHIATLLAAAAVTAGGAIDFQHTIAAPVAKHRTHHAAGATRPSQPTDLLATSAQTVSAPAQANYGGGAAAAVSTSGVRQNGAPRTPAGATRDRARPSRPRLSGGAGATSLLANPNGGSGLDAGTGVGPADLTGSATTPSGPLPGTAGAGAGDPSASAGGATASATDPSSTSLSASAGGQTTSGSDSSTSGSTSSSSGSATLAASSGAGAPTASPTDAPAPGYPATAPPQSTTTSRS
jgi:RNA polymerase sigma factor (sigma-70 family)